MAKDVLTSANDILSKDIIELLGLDYLSEQEKEDLRKEILETIQNRVFRRMEGELKESGKFAEYQEATKAGGEALDNFFEENGIDFNRLFMEETLIYKAQMVASNDLLKMGIEARAKTGEEGNHMQGE